MKKSTLGFDRFISLDWANYAFDLYCDQQIGQKEKKDILRKYLNQEIKGKETARKVLNQLFRLWLAEDEFSNHRELVKELNISSSLKPLIHYGMAINVFPIFFEVSKIIGVYSGIQETIFKQQIRNKTIEILGRPTTVLRSTDRILQTLSNWNFVEFNKKEITLSRINNCPSVISSWFLLSIVKSQGNQFLSIQDLIQHPLHLGVEIENIRNLITNYDWITISRNIDYQDMVSIGY